MLSVLAQAFWFILPAMVANMMPVYAAKAKSLDWLDKPLDHGVQWRGKPLFGANKTYRGLIVGVLGGAVVGAGQYLLTSNIEDFRWLMFHEQLNLGEYTALGALQGLGAMVGDAIESMLKRQVGIKPGNPWFPFDQTDYIIGALAFSLIIYMPTIGEVVAVFVVGFVLHLATVFLGYKVGMREKPI